MVLFGGRSPSSLKYRSYPRSSPTCRKGHKSRGRAGADFELPWITQKRSVQGKRRRLTNHVPWNWRIPRQTYSDTLELVLEDCLVARASKRLTALSTARAKSARFGIFSRIDYSLRNQESWVQVVNETELPLSYQYPSWFASFNVWPMFQFPPK